MHEYPFDIKSGVSTRKGEGIIWSNYSIKAGTWTFQSYWFIVVFVFAAYTVTETSPCYCRRRMLAADPSSPPQSLTLFSILSHPAFLFHPPYSSPPQSVTLSCPVFFSHHPTIILNHLFSTFSWLHLDTIQSGLHCIYISWFCDGAAMILIVMQLCSWELIWW